MPENSFYPLGRDPAKLNDVGREDKLSYPSLSLSVDEYPPLKDMKLGDTAEAMIRFRIGKHGGLDVMEMKHMNSDMMKDKKEETKEKLLRRHKKENNLMMSGKVEASDSGGY